MVQRQLQVNDQLLSVNGLQSCFGVQCEAKTQFLDCIQNVGCDFCEFDEDGSELPVSEWHCKTGACSYGSWAVGTNEAVGSNGAQGLWSRRSGAAALCMGMVVSLVLGFF